MTDEPFHSTISPHVQLLLLGMIARQGPTQITTARSSNIMINRSTSVGAPVHHSKSYKPCAITHVAQERKQSTRRDKPRWAARESQGTSLVHWPITDAYYLPPAVHMVLSLIIRTGVGRIHAVGVLRGAKLAGRMKGPTIWRNDAWISGRSGRFWR